jgi:hypothetical protein
MYFPIATDLVFLKYKDRVRHGIIMLACIAVFKSYPDLRGYVPSSRRGGPGSHLDKSMRYLWWTSWYWDMFSSDVFGFLLSISFRRGSPYLHITWG